MYRRKTVEAILRDHARERAAWAIERGNLLDRIMLMAHVPWTPPPVEVQPERPLSDPYEDFELPDQAVIEV
jgi:hypothetical protein